MVIMTRHNPTQAPAAHSVMFRPCRRRRKMKKKSLVLGALLVAGCDTTMTGSSGMLELSYTHGGLFESVSSPIGSGLMADVVIREVGSESSITIDTAETDDSSILAVSDIAGARMDLLAGTAGESILSVSAEGLSDDFAITVEDIASISYNPIVSSEAGYVIAAGASLWVPRTVYGLSMPEISPVDSATGIEDGAIGSTMVQFNSTGEVLLSDGIGEATSYTVVEASDVSWTIDDGIGEDGTITIGESPLLIVSGVDSEGRTALGSLSSIDPSICTVESFLGSADIYMLSALTEGACEVVLNGDTAAPFLSHTVVAE